MRHNEKQNYNHCLLYLSGTNKEKNNTYLPNVRSRSIKEAISAYLCSKMYQQKATSSAFH